MNSSRSGLVAALLMRAVHPLLCPPSGFNPKLKAAPARLATLRTPEGELIPPNTLAALKRDLERHQSILRWPTIGAWS
jgi:hypothetical protein